MGVRVQGDLRARVRPALVARVRAHRRRDGALRLGGAGHGPELLQFLLLQRRYARVHAARLPELSGLAGGALISTLPPWGGEQSRRMLKRRDSPRALVNEISISS